MQKENKKLKEEKEKIEEDAEYFLNGDYCDEKCNSVKNELNYKQALEKIQKMFSVPCIEGENCFTCNSKCSNKDVLNITVEVLNDRD